MISEEQQERAALYALGLLDADEAAAFEGEMAADGKLHALAVELHEATASLARTEAQTVPPEVKARVMERAAAMRTADKVIAGPWRNWLAYAAAAVLMIGCGGLLWSLLDLHARYRKTVAIAQTAIWKARATEAQLHEAEARNSGPDASPLRQVAFCSLEPVPTAQQTGPQAAVLWDAARRHGRLHITKLPSAGESKDYQLWTVETGVKDPVNAGIVKVGADDVADVEFQPESDDGKAQVVAFALSRERAGGVPKNEGPILFLGKLPN